MPSTSDEEPRWCVPLLRLIGERRYPLVDSGRSAVPEVYRSQPIYSIGTMEEIRQALGASAGPVLRLDFAEDSAGQPLASALARLPRWRREYSKPFCGVVSPLLSALNRQEIPVCID